MAVALVAVISRSLAAQRLVGQLVDLATSKPMFGATVQLMTPDNVKVGGAVTTDTTGAFSVTAPLPGVYRVKYDRFGYKTKVSIPVVLTPTEDVVVTAAIVPEDPMRAAMTAPSAAAMSATYFETRRQSGVGTILTKPDLDGHSYADLIDVVNGVTGVHVVRTRDHHWDISLRRDAARSTSCAPALFLNGARLNGLAGQYTDQAADLLFATPVTAVWGVEVYGTISAIPGIYQGNDMSCGVLAVWTRRPG